MTSNTLRRFITLIAFELRDHKSLWLVPLALFGLANLCSLQIKSGTISFKFSEFMLNPQFIEESMTFGTFVSTIFATILAPFLFIVVLLYSFYALYSERKDKTIHFWKSLPISHTSVVLSKLICTLICFLLGGILSWVAMIEYGLILRFSSPGDISDIHVRLQPIYALFRVLLYFFLIWVAVLPVLGWGFFVSSLTNRNPLVIGIFLPWLIVGLSKLLPILHPIAVLISYSFEALLSTWSIFDGQGRKIDDALLMAIHHPKFWMGVFIGVALIAASILIRKRGGIQINRRIFDIFKKSTHSPEEFVGNKNP